MVKFTWIAAALAASAPLSSAYMPTYRETGLSLLVAASNLGAAAAWGEGFEVYKRDPKKKEDKKAKAKAAAAAAAAAAASNANATAVGSSADNSTAASSNNSTADANANAGNATASAANSTDTSNNNNADAKQTGKKSKSSKDSSKAKSNNNNNDQTITIIETATTIKKNNKRDVDAAPQLEARKEDGKFIRKERSRKDILMQRRQREFGYAE